MTVQEVQNIIDLVRRAPLQSLHEAEAVMELLHKFVAHFEAHFAPKATEPAEVK